MTPRDPNCRPQQELRAHSKGWLLVIALGLALWSGVRPASAALVSAETPLTFFTNVASRLLQSQLGADIHRIQVYPTNEYTPALHRLLQVAANLYDATTNRAAAGYPYPPSIFRPRFTNDHGAIFICDYVEETGTTFLEAPWRDVVYPEARAALQADDQVLGIPLVIGAKKGFPNFNEVTVQSDFWAIRKLQLTRPTAWAGRETWRTNQMCLFAVTNWVGVEFWNSYQSNYPRPLSIYYEDQLSAALTNDAGLQMSRALVFRGTINLQSNEWRGIGGPTTLDARSFQVPLNTNDALVPLAVYHFDPPSLLPAQQGFEVVDGFPQPQWSLGITNRLRCWVIDTALGRVIDAVNFEPMVAIRNLSVELADPDGVLGTRGLWSTNRIGGTSVWNPPFGILNQLAFCLNPSNDTIDWTSLGPNLPMGAARQKEADAFRQFYIRSSQNTNLAVEVPLVVGRRCTLYQTWQAADPLVHYLARDLARPGKTDDLQQVPYDYQLNPLKNIGQVNNLYSPWGGNRMPADEQFTYNPDPYNPALRDPRAISSDAWEFPEGEPLTPRLLGRVHRGTPWQTLYLKSASIDLAKWQSWSGAGSPSEARLTMPTNDWNIVGLLVQLLSTNSPQALLSLNETRPDPWLTVLDGIRVLTNSCHCGSPYVRPQFEEVTMSADSPQAAFLASAIGTSRIALPGQRFPAVGDILSVPELSIGSPWLDFSSNPNWGITDEAYERIPAQLLERLRPDSIGSISVSNGLAQVTFSGLEGHAYVLEFCTRLGIWFPVSTNWPVNGLIRTTEPARGAGGRGFYRSVLVP